MWRPDNLHKKVQHDADDQYGAADADQVQQGHVDVEKEHERETEALHGAVHGHRRFLSAGGPRQ
ncbi:hypothetical protein DPMN_178569 [Dreissena polymorpha]|uniref:Uncharacterized protein n=1 Tax=Dreissena polymorpha TaxID=45954 RepID=A0A9D4EB63_DREPO|nr:hypothetical protein DPMN_178569 [Dreissena polymorpha]